MGMRCQICGRELDMQTGPEKIPFSPSARVLDVAGQPICTAETCMAEARNKWEKERDDDWKGVCRYEPK